MREIQTPLKPLFSSTIPSYEVFSCFFIFGDWGGGGGGVVKKTQKNQKRNEVLPSKQIIIIINCKRAIFLSKVSW